jgi:hypothetical protein
MTTPPYRDLRTRMHRVADEVTPLPVSDDLWRRGQAARHRGQALVVAAVLMVLASVGGGVALWSPSDREARTASAEVPEGAIPRVIADVPDDLEATSDLAVGRASAAFVSSSGDVVVVTANDGVPHRLALGGRDPAWISVALSPDGRTLAFQQGNDGGTRVAQLDLTTGRTKTLIVHAGDLLKLDDLSWSPRGDWLGWAASAMNGLPAFAGQVRPSGEESRRIAPPANVVSVVVADDGTSALGRVSGGALLWPPGRELDRLSRVPGNPGAFSPDGRHLALRSSPGLASYTLDTASREVLEHPFPDGTFGEAVVRPLGWLDDRLQLLLVQEIAGTRAELVVTTPEVDATSTWRSVGSVATTGVANSLSVAVDLVPDLDGTSSQELTHDFGDTVDDPPAPLGIELSLFIGLAVAAAIAALLGLRLLWRRLA